MKLNLASEKTSSLAAWLSSLTKASPQQTQAFTMHYRFIVTSADVIFRLHFCRSAVVQPDILCLHEHKEENVSAWRSMCVAMCLITHIWLIIWMHASHLLLCLTFLPNVWTREDVPTFQRELRNWLTVRWCEHLPVSSRGQRAVIIGGKKWRHQTHTNTHACTYTVRWSHAFSKVLSSSI